MKSQPETFKIRPNGRDHRIDDPHCPACIAHDGIPYPIRHADYSRDPVTGIYPVQCKGLMHFEVIDGPLGSQEDVRSCDKGDAPA
jgi:hypothetical protein